MYQLSKDYPSTLDKPSCYRPEKKENTIWETLWMTSKRLSPHCVLLIHSSPSYFYIRLRPLSFLIFLKDLLNLNISWHKSGILKNSTWIILKNFKWKWKFILDIISSFTRSFENLVRQLQPIWQSSSTFFFAKVKNTGDKVVNFVLNDLHMLTWLVANKR